MREHNTVDGIRSYRDLEVWKQAMMLAKYVYQVTQTFPSEEKFGLTNQMRRAAVSIPSNIAEGHARRTTSEYQHFVSIAIGSVAELETQVLLSSELHYMEHTMANKLLQQLDAIGKMLYALRKALRYRADDTRSR